MSLLEQEITLSPEQAAVRAEFFRINAYIEAWDIAPCPDGWTPDRDCPTLTRHRIWRRWLRS